MSSFDVLESVVHQTTVATRVSLGAIDQLLFREIDGAGGLTGDDQSGFDSTSGGESPARTALTLILDTGNLTSGNPVDIRGGILIVDSFSGVVDLEGEVGRLEFFGG